MNLHESYDKLTDTEREFVDEQFHRIFQQGRSEGIPLFCDDHAEVAVDAIAKLIIQSRDEKPWNIFEAPKRELDDVCNCEPCSHCGGVELPTLRHWHVKL